MRQSSEQVALFDVDTMVRSTDPDTSLKAAIKALRASRKAVDTIRTVMADGVERIDEEIWTECRNLGFISSLSTVQHGRLALQRAGLVRDSGNRRKTSEGAESCVWITTEETRRKVIVLLDSPTINPRRAVILAEKKRNRYAQAIVAAYQNLEEKISVVGDERVAAAAAGDAQREAAATARLSAFGEALDILTKALSSKEAEA